MSREAAGCLTGVSATVVWTGGDSVLSILILFVSRAVHVTSEFPPSSVETEFSCISVGGAFLLTPLLTMLTGIFFLFDSLSFRSSGN